MYAIEFETDIKHKYIELKNYEKLINKHAKIIVLVEDTPVLVYASVNPEKKKSNYL